MEVTLGVSENQGSWVLPKGRIAADRKGGTLGSVMISFLIQGCPRVWLGCVGVKS